jgi:DNA-binding response OmpR family regulator
MRVLVADDDRLSRRVVTHYLATWGHEVQEAADGDAAWQILRRDDGPPLAILDWMMPRLDGPEVCRRLRVPPAVVPRYLILLTSRDAKADTLEAFDAGVDDFLTKPFEPGELRARVEAGRRIVQLQAELTTRVRDLEAALREVDQLQQLIPICAYCRNIRDDAGFYRSVEDYLGRRSGVQFTHSICPSCAEKLEREPGARDRGTASR